MKRRTTRGVTKNHETITRVGHQVRLALTRIAVMARTSVVSLHRDDINPKGLISKIDSNKISFASTKMDSNKILFAYTKMDSNKISFASQMLAEEWEYIGIYIQHNYLVSRMCIPTESNQIFFILSIQQQTNVVFLFLIRKFMLK